MNLKELIYLLVTNTFLKGLAGPTLDYPDP